MCSVNNNSIIFKVQKVSNGINWVGKYEESDKGNHRYFAILGPKEFYKDIICTLKEADIKICESKESESNIKLELSFLIGPVKKKEEFELRSTTIS